MDDVVAVEGLKEAVRALRRVDAKKVTSRVHKEIAEIVADESRDSWRSQPSPRTKPSMAERVIRTSGTQTAAAIKLRAAKYPWAAGAEFGSYQFSQFRRWRGNKFTLAPGETAGYHIQPAIRDNLAKIEATYADRLMDEYRKEMDNR